MSKSRQQHNQYQQNRFRNYVGFYRQTIPEDVKQRTGEIVAAAALSPNDRVLDIGTGRGVLIPYFKRFDVGEIFACDLTQAMLNDAQTLHPDVIFWCGDFVDLPDSFGKFHALFFNAMFGNIWDQRLALSRACALLNPQGRIVLSHPMGAAFVEKLHEEDPTLVPNGYPNKARLEQLINDLPLRIESFRDEERLYLSVLQKTRD